MGDEASFAINERQNDRYHRGGQFYVQNRYEISGNVHPLGDTEHRNSKGTTAHTALSACVRRDRNAVLLKSLSPFTSIVPNKAQEEYTSSW